MSNINLNNASKYRSKDSLFLLAQKHFTLNFKVTIHIEQHTLCYTCHLSLLQYVLLISLGCFVLLNRE
jgi:hypothetical protein